MIKWLFRCKALKMRLFGEFWGGSTGWLDRVAKTLTLVHGCVAYQPANRTAILAYTRSFESHEGPKACRSGKTPPHGRLGRNFRNTLDRSSVLYSALNAHSDINWQSRAWFYCSTMAEWSDDKYDIFVFYGWYPRFRNQGIIVGWLYLNSIPLVPFITQFQKISLAFLSLCCSVLQ